MSRKFKPKRNKFLLISGGRCHVPGYNITFRALSLNLAAGDILIKDLSISPDPANRLTDSIL